MLKPNERIVPTIGEIDKGFGRLEGLFNQYFKNRENTLQIVHELCTKYDVPVSEFNRAMDELIEESFGCKWLPRPTELVEKVMSGKSVKVLQIEEWQAMPSCSECDKGLIEVSKYDEDGNFLYDEYLMAFCHCPKGMKHPQYGKLPHHIKYNKLQHLIDTFPNQYRIPDNKERKSYREWAMELGEIPQTGFVFSPAGPIDNDIPF